MTKKAAKTDPVLNALLIAVIIIGLLFSVQVSGLMPARSMSIYGGMPTYWMQPVQQYPVYGTPTIIQYSNGRRVWSNRAAVRRTEREMRIHFAAPASSSSSSSRRSGLRSR